MPLALLLGVGGCQMSLRAGRAALAEDVGSDAATPCGSNHGAVLRGGDDDELMLNVLRCQLTY